MKNKSHIEGHQNIVIQGVTDSSITLNVNGETQEVLNKLDALRALLEKLNSSTIQLADKVYDVHAINDVNFDFLVGQVGHTHKLPAELAENIISDDNRWIDSLRQELLKLGVSVRNRPLAIYEHYGWLIEAFLQKMGTPPGKERTLRRLSFMAEAFQSSLRYLCYIQLAQIFQRGTTKGRVALSGFIGLQTENYEQFDLLNFLITTTELLEDTEPFMAEIVNFVEELTDSRSELYGAALFLQKQRSRLLSNTIAEDEQLPALLDEYLTALVFWLRNIAFLSRYRLVSVKDISLKYRLGTTQNFVHLYGELHGIYNEEYDDQDDFITVSVEGLYTYNQSVILFKGNDVASCLKNIEDTSTYLSLSPLIIDQSVYANKTTQTPEICYYIGKTKRQFNFAQYKNELPFGGQDVIKSNKFLQVKRQNNNQPKLNELYEQIEQVFKPFLNGRS